MVVGTAPLFAAAMAIVFLDEPIEAPLVIGGLLVVGAGLVLVSEPTRPEHVRLSGIAIAFAATLLFTSRDEPRQPRPLVFGRDHERLGEGRGSRDGGRCLGTLLFLTATRGRRLGADAHRIAWRPFAVGGVFFGLSYVCLFAAYYRARVTVISPSSRRSPSGA